jgi:hypothetical protein
MFSWLFKSRDKKQNERTLNIRESSPETTHNRLLSLRSRSHSATSSQTKLKKVWLDQQDSKPQQEIAVQNNHVNTSVRSVVENAETKLAELLNLSCDHFSNDNEEGRP